MEKRYTPLVILALVAALVAMSWLYVGAKSQSFQHASQGTASNQQRFEWRLVTTWPKHFPGLGMGPERFAERVEKMSAGRLKIKVYGGGELVPALGVFDAVSMGTVEMGHGAGYYWKGKVPAAPFFTTVPFGMNAQEMNSWIHYGEGGELWREAYEPFNLIPLAAGNSGVQMAGWFADEIHSLDDLQGLKMRIPGLGGEVFSRVGGTAITVPGSEIYTSLQTGVIDATEWVGPYNDLAIGLHQVADYYYYPGWHEPGPALEMLVNKTAFEQLPADLQQIVISAARETNQDMLDEYTALNQSALTELVETHGVQLRKLPDDVLKALHQASDEVLAELAADDPFTGKVYAAYQRFAEGAKAYHRYTEQAYINARDQ